MPTEVTETASQSKRRQKAPAAATKPSVPSGTQRNGKNAIVQRPSSQPSARRTKQETILALLGRADGATMGDLIEVTGWQKHSIRGFLAGTVKKKLGLALTSLGEGDLRRYRILTRRGR